MVVKAGSGAVASQEDGVLLEADEAVEAAAPKAARPRAKAKSGRRRAVLFSKKRAAVFLTTLGEVCNVAAACRASGLSDTTVYRRRQSDPDFLAAWRGAVREGLARLEAEMLDRALNGKTKTVWHGGKKVGTVRDYNDRLALALLAMHGRNGEGGGGGSGKAGAPVAAVSIEQLRAEIMSWLGTMNRRMGGAG